MVAAQQWVYTCISQCIASKKACDFIILTVWTIVLFEMLIPQLSSEKENPYTMDSIISMSDSILMLFTLR